MDGIVGEPVCRKEDGRLLTGQGRFSDDFNLPGQTYAAMVRSPWSHAVLHSIDTVTASAMPGVLAIYTGADCVLDGLGNIPHDPLPKTNFDMKLSAPGSAVGDPVFIGSHVPLPADRSRYVGEAVAMVVAETKAQAADAAEAVEVDYQPLDAVTDTDAAGASGAPRLWDELPDNILIETLFGDASEIEAVFADAAHTVSMHFDIGRVTGVPMEPRAVLGAYDEATGRYTVYAGSGGVVRQKREIAAVLGVEAADIRVVAFDVGGNFGTRNRVYVEFPLVAWASRKLGRPVKYTAMRGESFISDYQGRDLCLDLTLALDCDGNFLGLRSSNLSNVGARCVSLSPLSKGVGIATGCYQIPTAQVRARATFSNTPPTNAYRSSGRPEIIFAIERLVDTAAWELGFDRIELRRRNLVPVDAMPYDNAVGMRYDSGGYEACLDKAIALNKWDGFAARRALAEARGLLLGRGVCSYVESSIGTPVEQTEFHVQAEGERLDVVIGTQPSGQGHETSFAQVAADGLGLPFEQVRILLGDTDVVKVGGGSHSGRSMRMAGTVIVKAVERFIEQGRGIAAQVMEAAVADVDYESGRFLVSGTDRSMTIYELALAAEEKGLPEEALSVTVENEMHTPVFPNGCHICETEVDPETGYVRITRYAAVDDVGRAINPLIIDGQTHGGLVQGVGQAMWEQCVFDEFGQPLSGSFMDYGMPRADHFPYFETELHEVPSPTNPLGVKAGGEGGTTAALGVIVNAVVDALRPYGIRDLKMPLTPYNVWRAIRNATISV